MPRESLVRSLEFSERLPFSFEAEQSVLGAVILDEDVLNSILPILKNSDPFYVKNHKQIYDVMLSMHLAGKPIDFVTLLEAVKGAGIFDEAEGKQYLLQLTQIVPSTENAVGYAKIVADKAILRALIAVTNDVRAKCEEGGDSAAGILEFAETGIYNVANGRTNTELYAAKEGYRDAIDRYSVLVREGKEKLLGVPTGYYDLDSMFAGGLRKNELVVLAARPAVGKSSLALNIAANAAIRHGIKTVYFSLEMGRESLMDRVLASEALVDNARLMTGALEDKDWESLAETGKYVGAAPLYFDDASDITISQMKAKLRRVKGLGLVIVDHLQLLNSDRRFENRVNEVGELTRSLKLMAMELQVPVLLLSQLSRRSAQQGEARKPTLVDLRDSGTIEQDADIVIFLHNENQTSGDVENKCVLQAIVGKNRRGRCGTAELLWVGKYTKFLNLDKKHADE
mgnify:FL=1